MDRKVLRRGLGKLALKKVTWLQFEEYLKEGQVWRAKTGSRAWVRGSEC